MMNSKLIILLILNSIGPHLKASMLSSFEIDQNAGLYRLIIESEFELCFDDLSSPSDGLSPRGISIQLRDNNGEIISICGIKRYSSANLSSEDPFKDSIYISSESSRKYTTQWLPIKNLFRGINRCITGDNTLSAYEFRISAIISTKNGPMIKADTEWFKYIV